MMTEKNYDEFESLCGNLYGTNICLHAANIIIIDKIAAEII